MFTDEAYVRADKARRALLAALIEDGLLLHNTPDKADPTPYTDAQEVLDHIGVEGVDALKIQDLSNDSLEILSIIVTLEEDLEIDIDDSKAEKFMLEDATIGSVLPVITGVMGG